MCTVLDMAAKKLCDFFTCKWGSEELFRICNRFVRALFLCGDYVVPVGKLVISVCKLDVVFSAV